MLTDVTVVAGVDPKRAALASRAKYEDDEATAVVIATIEGEDDVTTDHGYEWLEMSLFFFVELKYFLKLWESVGLFPP